MLTALRRLRERAGTAVPGRPGGVPAGRVVALAAVITAVLGGGVVYAAAGQPPRPPGRGVAHAQRVRGAAVSAAALRVLSVSPADGARGVNGAGPVRVVFSVPLAPDSPLPGLAPAIPGSWQRTGPATLTFTPAVAFAPLTSVRVTVPAGRDGVRSAVGRLLASPVTARFTTGQWQAAGFVQLLARLGYLPLTWAPARHGVAGAGSQAELSAAFDPPAGTFSWRPGYPASLRRLWTPATANVIVRGAVMAFQSDQGLAMDGVTGPATWRAMLRAAAAGQANRNGYTYALWRPARPAPRP